MITDKFHDYRIILASRSPRRQQMLQELGLKFDIVIKEYDEIYPNGLCGEEIARFISFEKAALFRNELNEKEIVITADTIVWCNSQVLGKPIDREDAARILREISGNTHEVITGVSLRSKNKEITFSESTKVTFEPLSEETIYYYIDNYKPYDKAGAYGIQEMAAIFVEKFEGDYPGAVGLPLYPLVKDLKKVGIEVL
jgi:septum formation protein